MRHVRAFPALSLLLIVLLVSGCDTGGSAQEGSTPEEKELGITVATDSLVLGGVGDTTRVDARVVNTSTGNVIPDASVSWSSADRSVATVTDAGLVQAQSEGETKIKASHDGDTKRVFAEVIEAKATSKSTGSNGEVEIRGDTFQFVNASTGEPVTDLQVTLLEGDERSVFVAKDKEREYPTVIRKTKSSKIGIQKTTNSKILATISMWKYAFGDELIATMTGELPPGTLRWAVRNFYECKTGTLSEAARNIEDFGTWPDNVEKVSITVVFEGFSSLVERVTGNYALSVLSSVISIRDIKSVIENRIKVWFFGRQYGPTSKFKYCAPDGTTASLVFGDDMIMIPKGPPPEEATETGILEGEIKDKETGELLPATLDLAGPSPRGVSVDDGSFRFEDLLLGEYTLTVTSRGYEKKTLDVTIRDATATGDVRLESTNGGRRYEPGNGYQYFTTQKSYDPDQVDIVRTIKNKYGQDAELADWTTLKDLYSSDKSGLISFLDGVGMTERGDDAYLTRNGNQFWGSDRHYFLKRHNGDVGGNFLVHDAMHSNTISLGSWYNSKKVLVRLPK